MARFPHQPHTVLGKLRHKCQAETVGARASRDVFSRPQASGTARLALAVPEAEPALAGALRGVERYEDVPILGHVRAAVPPARWLKGRER